MTFKENIAQSLFNIISNDERSLFDWKGENYTPLPIETNTIGGISFKVNTENHCGFVNITMNVDSSFNIILKDIDGEEVTSINVPYTYEILNSLKALINNEKIIDKKVVS